MSIKSLSSATRTASLLAGSTPEHHVLLQSYTVSAAGGDAAITFNNISQDYQHLQVRAYARGNGSGVAYDSIYIRVNGDSGSNYTLHWLNSDGGATASVVGIAPYSAFRMSEIAGSTATASVFGGFIFDLLDYTSTTKYKTGRTLGGFDNNGTGGAGLRSCVWMNSASPVTSMTLVPVFGSSISQFSSFYLYGVK